MRSAARTPLGRLAIVVGVVAVALAVTVPIALGRGLRGRPGHQLRHLHRRQGRQGEPEALAGRDRRDQHAGRPGARRAGLDERRQDARSSTSTTTSAASRATRSSSATASPPPRRRKERSAASSSRTTSGSRSSSSARSPSATSRSTRRSATRSRPSAASSSCRSTRSGRTGFALFGTNDSVLGPWGTLGKDVLHAKTAAVVYVADPRDRLRREGREGEPRVGGDQDDAGRLRRQRDRPDRAAHRGRRPERRHDRAADRTPPAASTSPRRSQQLGKSSTPVVSNPLCLDPAVSGGPRRRPAEVDLRHRLVARLRHDRPGRRRRSSRG